MAKKKASVDAPAAETPAHTPAPPPAKAGTEYTVLARRYRPQQFSDLVGQEPVAQALVNALQSGRVAHAYLFTGARGVGKTSAARIFAKAINCVNGPTATPCDVCDSCKAIITGEDQDVLEIDAASNTGVDNIRELRQNAHFRPTRSRFKIYIIDEIHMLSTGAFNALLKTLEEPPAHVKFIFATTEIQKIPVTVLSRCQRFDFGGISVPRILQRLQGIVASEHMEADEEALEMVARRAGGSMRDAQSLLDQLLAFSGKKLTVDSVHELLGTAHEERVTALADAVLAKDAKRALEVINDVLGQGQQLGELFDQLIEYWRDMMVVNAAGIQGQSLSVTSARRGTLEQHAKKTSLDIILAGMDILVTAKSRLRFTSNGRILLEMALVRLAQLEGLISLAQMADMLNKGGVPSAPTARPSASAARPAFGAQAPSSPLPAPEKKKLTPEEDATSATITFPLREETLAAIWQQVVEKSGIALQAEMRKVTSLAISGPNALVLKVSPRYNTPSGSFLEPARLGKIEEQLSQIVGQRCTVRIESLAEAPSEPAATNGQSPTASAMGQQRQLRAGMLQIPFVKQAADVLNAQIVRADDGFGAAAKASPAEAEETTEGE